MLSHTEKERFRCVQKKRSITAYVFLKKYAMSN